MQVVQLITYAAVVIGVVAIIAKAMRYIKAPTHFRWELYPVPHERGRADYGGSYLEELDWWTKPRHSDFFREIKEMAEEIFLLKGVFRNNLKVWTFSMPFHFGLYICIGWLGLLVIGGIIQAAGGAVSMAAGGLGAVIQVVTVICGYAGMVLAGIGALGLFFWRATDKNQRPYNAPVEYINLLFFVVVVAITLIGQLTADPGFINLRGYVQSLITFSGALALNGWLVTEIVLGSLLIMYIPLGRMSHFVAKYFLYHSVRWNDTPNPRGSEIEKHIVELLNQKVGWKGPHIQTGQPWTEVVKEMKHE
jgi:nitrate reductase gamma subunit